MLNGYMHMFSSLSY